MAIQPSSVNRYSDADLEFFRDIISQKLERTEEELNSTLERVENMTEAMESEGDWMDDTSSGAELEMLYTMVNRLKHHKRDLENALLRVKNKSFGICVVTGELIDKRRLLAVPTTTKSLAAKNEAAQAVNKPIRKSPAAITLKMPGERKIISRVISKPAVVSPKIDPVDFEEDFEDDEDFDDEDFQKIEIDDDNLDD